MAGSSYKRIESSAKTLQVLDFIMRRKDPANVKEITEGCGMAQGTLMTHLVTLEDEGYIEKVGDAYRLTMKISIGWARKKSMLESEIEQRQKELELIS